VTRCEHAPAHLQVPDVEQFMSEYHMQCPLAASRLLHVGMPATVEHISKQRYAGHR